MTVKIASNPGAGGELDFVKRILFSQDRQIFTVCPAKVPFINRDQISSSFSMECSASRRDY